MLTKRRHSHRADARSPKDSAQQMEADISAGLSAIYGDERDDLKVVTKGGSRLTRFLLRAIVALTVICVLTLGGYVVYSRYFGPEQQGKPLAMAFVASDDMRSGADATIEFDYANQTSYPLTNVEIDMNLPAGFVMKSSTPAVTSAADMVFDLGTISGKSDGKILIEGIWNADVPSTTGIQALASYQPANFNAQFHDIVTKTIATNTSTTIVAIDAPETVNVGETVTYTVHVQNAGTETIVAPQVKLTLPKGFFVQTSVPPLAAGGAPTYTLPDIPPAAPAADSVATDGSPVASAVPVAPIPSESTIVVTGAFASDASGTQTLTVVSGIAGTRFSPQTTTTALTDVKGSALSLLMVGNGSQGTVVADPGSLFRIALRIDNTSDTAIADATALLDFTAEDNLPIDWGTAVLAGGKVTAKGITFDAKTIGTVAAGSHKTLDLAFPMKLDLSAVSSAFSVAFSATRGAITVQSAPLTVQLNSDAAILSTLRYFDDDGAPLGSGPLPPMAGSTTHYRATWTIASGLHGLDAITVSATLPEGVTWDDFSTATSGSMLYDVGTRIVRWTMSSIPAGSAAVTARFSVSITPTAADVGLAKTLVGKTVLNAKDDMTGSVLERSADAVTTECEGDVLTTGKGTVKASI
ncbi:MAG: CARDB domain-containing protein [Patescibacteria group bacterium]